MTEQKSTLLDRAYMALKTLTGKSIPFADGGSSYFSSYTNWGEWDKATDKRYADGSQDFSTSSLVMSAVRLVGKTLPEAPLQVKESTGNQGESEVMADHDLVSLWHTPNDFYSGSTLNKGVSFSWVTRGDVYIRKIWNDARTRPVQLWWEPHWLIRPRWYGDNGSGGVNSGPLLLKEGDDLNAYILYYELDRGNMGQKYRLEVDDVIHFRDGFDPQNSRRGLSGLGSVLRELYGDSEAANYYARLMGGSGVPPFIASVDASVNMTPDQQKEFAAELERRTSSNNPDQKKFLVAKGVTVEKLGLSPKDLDLSETRLMAEDRFAAVTGITAVMLELAAGRKNSIYNNVKQAAERYTESYLVPLWRHIGEELTVQLLPDFETGGQGSVSVKSAIKRGDAVWFDSPAVKAKNGRMRYVAHDLSRVRALAEDEDAKHRRVALDYRNGLIDRAEGRSSLGYDVRDEDKDVFFPNTGSKAGDEPTPPVPPELVKAIKAMSNGHEHEFKDFRCVVCQKSLSEIAKEAEAKAAKVPSDEEQDAAVEWWERNAPEPARDLINAKVKE